MWKEIREFAVGHIDKPINMDVLTEFRSKFGQDATIVFNMDEDECKRPFGIYSVVFSAGDQSFEALHPSRRQ